MGIETTRTPDQPMKRETLQNVREQAQAMIARHKEDFTKLQSLQEISPSPEFDRIAMEKTETFRRELEQFLADHREAFSDDEAKAMIGSISQEVVNVTNS